MPMSDYMANLRAKVGDDLVLTPAAGAAIFDGDGRLLLGRHVDHGLWATLGGAVEPLESPAEAAVREVKEESGLDVELLGLVGAYGGPDFQVTYPDGNRVAYVLTMYGGRVTGGEPRLQQAEISELRWCRQEEVEDAMLPADMRRVVPDAFAWLAGDPPR